MKKLLVIGHARHGKDTVAEMLHDLYGYSFTSSSQAAADIFIYDQLKDVYGYKSPWECFEDRVNHRDDWYQLICWFNQHDKARLAKNILLQTDIYVGMRDNAECEESLRQGLFDLVIGVYDPRKPLEPSTSFNIDLWAKSDIVIPNGSSLEDLKNRVRKIEPLLFDQFNQLKKTA